MSLPEKDDPSRIRGQEELQETFALVWKSVPAFRDRKSVSWQDLNPRDDHIERGSGRHELAFEPFPLRLAQKTTVDGPIRISVVPVVD